MDTVALERQQAISRKPDLANVIVPRREPQPSKVFDTYWRFAAERQAIFHRRVRGEPAPWTGDTVISAHRFTNPYRASDRVSQYLIRNVIYGGTFGVRDTVLRTLLFKLFNKIQTWELIERELGSVTEASFDTRQIDGLLTRALDSGAPIYSAAYIMPSGPASVRTPRKHQMHLALLLDLLERDFPERLQDAATMGDAYRLLLALPGLGPFLGYQYVTDLNYSEYFSFDEMEFVVAGPGARDGVRKCFADPGDYNEADLIRWVAERQNLEFDRRALDFESLWGRSLQLIDCQNLFCEVDKYARVAHPEVRGITGRTRIKQHFAPSQQSLAQPWFPPKWNINAQIAAEQRCACAQRELRSGAGFVRDSRNDDSGLCPTAAV